MHRSLSQRWAQRRHAQVVVGVADMGRSRGRASARRPALGQRRLRWRLRVFAGDDEQCRWWPIA